MRSTINSWRRKYSFEIINTIVNRFSLWYTFTNWWLRNRKGTFRIRIDSDVECGFRTRSCLTMGITLCGFTVDWMEWCIGATASWARTWSRNYATIRVLRSWWLFRRRASMMKRREANAMRSNYCLPKSWCPWKRVLVNRREKYMSYKSSLSPTGPKPS